MPNNKVKPFSAVMTEIGIQYRPSGTALDHQKYRVMRRRRCSPPPPLLRAPSLDEAPVRDVREVHHESEAADGVAQDGGAEGGRVLPDEVGRKEAAMGAAHRRHPRRVDVP